MKIEFVVHGQPVGKGRPVFSTYGGRITARTPQKTVVYENFVKMEYGLQCGDFRFPNDAVLRTEIQCFYAIPKSAAKAKRSQMLDGSLRPTKKPDLDNCIKAILDALNGTAYHDDAQVVSVTANKFYSDNPRVEVTVEQLGVRN